MHSDGAWGRERIGGMVNRRFLTGRFVIRAEAFRPTLRDRRRAVYRRKMQLQGVRPASIKRYLSRGFPSRWSLAVRAEMAALIADLWFPRTRHQKRRRRQWRNQARGFAA